MTLCKCGCDKEIEVKSWHKTRGIPLYKKGIYCNANTRPDII